MGPIKKTETVTGEPNIQILVLREINSIVVWSQHTENMLQPDAIVSTRLRAETPTAHRHREED